MEGAGQALSFSGTLRAYIVMQLMIIMVLMTRSETNPVPREPQIAVYFQRRRTLTQRKHSKCRKFNFKSLELWRLFLMYK